MRALVSLETALCHSSEQPLDSNECIHGIGDLCPILSKKTLIQEII